MSAGEPIPLSRPDITDADIAAVTKVFASDRLSIGPQTEAFESALAIRANRRHGIAVNSGTSGLHLLVKALGLKEGDEVVTTPFSFIATTNCLLFERVKPIFADIDPGSYNLDPAALEAAITPRTKAILPVEVFGNMAHFDVYEAIARKHGLMMIEDCCEALGGKLAARHAGSFGDGGVFAFYPNKQITTGEGGVIVTDSDPVADVCRSMRNQGRDTKEWLSHSRLGYNYRMSELTAALGVSQAARLDEIVTKRRRAADLYLKFLGEIEEINLPPMTQPKQASWFVFVIRLADRFSQVDRNSLMDHLHKRGIGCNPYFVPIHLQPYVREMLGTREGQFAVTERVAARTIALPFFSMLNEGQVKRVKAAIEEWLSVRR